MCIWQDPAADVHTVGMWRLWGRLITARAAMINYLDERRSTRL